MVKGTKFLMLAVTFLAMLMVSGVAWGEKGPYMGVAVGMTQMRDSIISDPSGTGKVEFERGFTSAIAVGYNFNPFRLEGELGYQEFKVDKISVCAGGLCVSNIPSGGNVSAWTLLVNGYYDFVNKSPITPYLTAGVGLARLDIDDFSVLGIRIGSADDVVFAYQVGAGVAFSLSEKIKLDVRYRYLGTSDPDFKGVKAEYAGHNVFLGLRFGF